VDKAVSWTAYSLDGQANVSITQNTTLTGLPKGSHTLTVYAQDAIGLIEASNSINFVVDDAPPQETPNEDDRTSSTIEPFPTTLVAASVITVAVFSVGLLYSFKKRKH
jgi:hypothetical protein